LKRIAVVRSVFLPISETFIYGEIRKLNHYAPYVFCSKRINKHTIPHENVIVDPRHRQLDRMLGRGLYQLIHARFGMSGIRMMPLKQKWRVPLVTSFHGCDSPSAARMKNRRKKLRRLFSVGECFTVPCQSMKDELVRYGCPAHKVVVHYSGIDVDQFAYRVRTAPLEGPVRIMYVGRLVEKKGAELLIRAFRQVRKVLPHTKLCLIGDGPLRKKLKLLCKHLRLDQHVEFMGALAHHEVAGQLDQAHIFCLPSLKDRTGNQEGIPNALKEAMACGLPVVSTYHSGIPELIEDGVTGHLVSEKNAGELAGKLIHLVRQPETWGRLGMNARAKIESDFDQRVQTMKLELLFDQVILDFKRKEREIQENPFFSVIIPTYNREKYIGKAIRSVLNQTCKDYEIIVVDDGSTDRTAQIVDSFGAQVRYVPQINSGPSEARNTGIRMAKGKYIAFLDSDDQFLPHKLESNKRFLVENPDCHFLYSWYYDRRRGNRPKIVRDSRGCKEVNKFRFYLYARKFTIRTSTAVIHSSCFQKVGGFNPKYRYSQDWDMWLRLASHYRGYCQKKALVFYRRHPRKPIPARIRHLKIRRDAFQLYQWNAATLKQLQRKYKTRTKTRKARPAPKRPSKTVYRITRPALRRPSRTASKTTRPALRRPSRTAFSRIFGKKRRKRL
jgi:colanic acid/amylovoran biosynthesis glycosyltransferase